MIQTPVLKKYTEAFFEVLAPRHCEVCGKPTGNLKTRFEFFCDNCAESMPLAPEPEVILNHLITNIKGDDLSLSGAYCLFSVSEDFDFIKLIYSLKYDGFTRVGKELGLELGKIIQKYKDTDYDYLVPVPIHHARQRERGFNQSEIITEAVSSVLNTPIGKNIVKRNKYTQSQTLLSSSERKMNVSDVFIPAQKNLNLFGKSFLLIDDVLTTGSTLNACGNCLLELGAKRVDCAALAFA